MKWARYDCCSAPIFLYQGKKTEFSACYFTKDGVYYSSTCRCDEMVDVVDSKCSSSPGVILEKVVAVQGLLVYNLLYKFNIPPAYPS